jgi:hypothetical protein
MNNDLAAYLLVNIGTDPNNQIDLNLPADFSTCADVAFNNLNNLNGLKIVNPICMRLLNFARNTPFVA